MEIYGRNPGRERFGSGHHGEWSPVGAGTGLQESMWQLGLRSKEAYPERLGMPDCSYYMRTGICGFGTRCRYNHPPDWTTAVVRYDGDYPERPGELACRFYLKTGTCKFGQSCKFDHPKHASDVPLNYNGFPLRPGEVECSYYLKTGQCKFGKTCRFHHPQPSGMSIPASTRPFCPTEQSHSAEQYGGVSTSWRVARPPLLPSTYVPGAYGHLLLPTGMVSISSWGTPYSAPVSPVLSPGAQPTVGAATLYRLPQISSLTSPHLGTYSPLPSSAPPNNNKKGQIYPERPGQPNCQYYLKTGDCKFGSSCRFHHPPDYLAPKTDCVYSPLGLPLRPGVQSCTFYEQNGYCKFGPLCKFDHPMRAIAYTPSASSLIDMPAAYQVGSSLVSQLPSTSSPELILSRSKNDSHPTRMSSSVNGSSSSSSFIFSQNGSGSLSAVQLSSQTSASLSSRNVRTS